MTHSAFAVFFAMKKIPDECLVLETDRTEASAAECPTIPEICAKVAELRGRSSTEIELLTDANARRFILP